MLNTQEQLEPLLKRVQFEDRVIALPLDGPVQVKLSKDGKSAEFQQGNQVLLAKVERPLIHQLGSRLWGTQNYSDIFEQWCGMSTQALEQELTKVFSQHDLVARYYVDTNGKNRVYGVVSPNFVDVNPLEYRQQFIEQVRQSTALGMRSDGLVTSKNGDVMEWFDFQTSGFQTEYKYGLYYARNSGYDAYKVYGAHDYHLFQWSETLGRRYIALEAHPRTGGR